MLYFCVGNMFYIPIRNSRKSYKWLGASPFFVCIFVSEICDSSQCFVGESHSLSVQCVLMFITLVIWSCSWWFIPEPETFQKLENNILMFASEPKFLYFCVRNIYFFFYTDQKTRKSRKLKFLGLKHTILLNILLINHMDCRYNKLIYVLVLVLMIWS